MIEGLNHITLAVSNIETSFLFYKDILGFKPLVKWDQGAYFLVPTLPPQAELWFCLNVDPARQPNLCYTHYAFTVSPGNFNSLVEKIQKSGARTFKENKSFGESFYFFDPDGHKLEIHASHYPARLTYKKTNPGSWKNIEWFT